MMTMQRHAWHIEHRSHILHVVEIKFPDLKAACNRNFIPGVTILCKSDQYWLGFQLKGKVFDRYGTGTLSEMVNLITASFQRILAKWHRFDVGFSNGAESSSKDPSWIRLTLTIHPSLSANSQNEIDIHFYASIFLTWDCAKSLSWIPELPKKQMLVLVMLAGCTFIGQ